jgi:predicted amidohydrolase YtcJ
MPSAPDLLLVNASVRTMDPARPRARAVAVTGGLITYVGDEAAEAAGGVPAASTAGRVIDLKGATLLPGFHDAHNHMIGFGLSLTEVDLRAGSLDEIYDRVAARAAVTPAGEWIIGAGYDQVKTGAHPHRDALDRIAPGHRVWLKHTSSHMCVVNSLVLRDLGIDTDTQPVDGGRVATDAGGAGTDYGYHAGGAGSLSQFAFNWSRRSTGWRTRHARCGRRRLSPRSATGSLTG